MTLKVLLVDDDEGVRKTAKTDLPEKLKDQGVQSTVEVAGSIREALTHLKESPCDLAVVDLSLGGAASGNDVIKQIVEHYPLPIIVYSGYPNELADDYKDHGLIAIVKKKNSDVAAQVAEWKRQGIFDVFTPEGNISRALRQTLQRTMWGHVSRRWKYLPHGDAKEMTRVTGRIAATLFSDILAHEGAEGDTEIPIHHGEIYIFQTPRPYLTVGDVLKTAGGYKVVLTPACDLVPHNGSPKANMVLVASAKTLKEFANEKETSNKKLLDEVKRLANTGNSGAEAKEKVARFMRQSWLNEDGRLFALPPFAEFPGLVVDFLRVEILPFSNEAERKATNSARIVSLNRGLAAELAARYARYMVRLGQPAYQVDPLAGAVADACK